jgi:glucan 1,3-beta-glucosidase
MEQSSSSTTTWIRGVNIGGWLLAERFITPYLFALNTCHLNGDLCWYKGQIGAPPNATLCDPVKCKPVLPLMVTDGNADVHLLNDHQYMGYPIDELTLGQAMVNKEMARNYMARHWDTFLTLDDLKKLKKAGVTHLRVPMGYWIRGDIRAGESWVDGGWPYFVRFAKWARKVGLIVWADLHGAPGSENGFDNSGQYLTSGSTCKGWSTSPTNVERTLEIVQDIANGIVEEGLTDVVTGFGVLNEPFLDCDEDVLRNYYNAAFDIIRSTMGQDTSVFIGDMFSSWKWNDGWWADDEVHHDTYLDSHPYHVFFEKGRAFTPRQHIAYVCRHGMEDVTSCCYEDHPANTMPARGISRIVGEWSAAFDKLPTALTPFIMKSIAANGTAPQLDRRLSAARMAFMRTFVQAQMVAYEAQATGVSSGWLFWNFKME